MARKKKKWPTSDPIVRSIEDGADARERELEDMGTKILESADKAMLEAIAANVQTLCDSFAQLKLPSDDPEYLKRLQTTEAQRNTIANQVGAVHIVPDSGETWIGISISNRRDQAQAREVARLMGEHFEAKVISHGE